MCIDFTSVKLSYGYSVGLFTHQIALIGLERELFTTNKNNHSLFEHQGKGVPKYKVFRDFKDFLHPARA